MQKLLTFFQQNYLWISMYAIFNDQSFNDTLTNDIVSFEQLGPGFNQIATSEYLLSVYNRTKVYLHQNFLKVVVVPRLFLTNELKLRV